MNRLLYIVLVVSVLALAVGTAATAAFQDGQLNTVASEVAGHPVVISCATDSSEWSQDETSAGYTFEVDGFTYATLGNVVYLSPRVCQTLRALLGPGHDDVGALWAALAIKTLIHESEHQSGVFGEAAADCAALPLVTRYAVESFGYPAVLHQWRYVKISTGRYKRVLRTIPNPELARLAYWAMQWHLAMPANYQGGC